MAVNIEKVYTSACKALRFTVETTMEDPKLWDEFYASILNDPASYKDIPPWCYYAAIINQCKTQIASNSGRGSALTAAKNLLKQSKVFHKQEDLQKAWMQDGKQYMVNGFYGVILNDPIPGVPMHPEGKVGFENFDTIINNAKRNANKEYMSEELSATYLSKYIKEAKACYPDSFTYKGDAPMIFVHNTLVRAEYLKDVLTLLPDAKIYTTATSNAPFLPLYFESSSGVGVLMCINYHTYFLENFENKYPFVKIPDEARKYFKVEDED